MHTGSNSKREYQIAEISCVSHEVILKRVKKDDAAKAKAITQMQIKKKKNSLKSSDGCCQVPRCSHISSMKTTYTRLRQLQRKVDGVEAMAW